MDEDVYFTQCVLSKMGIRRIVHTMADLNILLAIVGVAIVLSALLHALKR